MSEESRVQAQRRRQPATSNQQRRQQRGFSLIEVLVAVALLAVILLALFSLVSMGVQRAYSGKKMTEATILAQAAMERANVYEPHTLLGLPVDSDANSVTQTWTRTSTATTGEITAIGATAPTIATGTATPAGVEQDAWKALLQNANLQAYDDRPATLAITMTAVPEANPSATPPIVARTFANATMVRIQVDLTWHEWGSRRRQVRLQALNLRESL